MISFKSFFDFLKYFLLFAYFCTCSILEAISDPVKVVGLNFEGIVLQLGSSGTSLGIDLSLDEGPLLYVIKSPLTNIMGRKLEFGQRKGVTYDDH